MFFLIWGGVLFLIWVAHWIHPSFCTSIGMSLDLTLREKLQAGWTLMVTYARRLCLVQDIKRSGSDWFFRMLITSHSETRLTEARFKGRFAQHGIITVTACDIISTFKFILRTKPKAHLGARFKQVPLVFFDYKNKGVLLDGKFSTTDRSGNNKT